MLSLTTRLFSGEWPNPDTECTDLYADCKFWAAIGDCSCQNSDQTCEWQHFVLEKCPISCNDPNCVTTTPKPTPKPTEIPKPITTPEPTPECTCPAPFGHFPMEDCNKFCHCSHGIGHIKACPGDLHFSPVTKHCMYPEEAKCGK